MARLLYPAFSSDAQQYEQAEAYWRQTWTDLLQHAGQASEWRLPWLPNQFADGTACRDGNPIFSAVNDRRKLGVRIIQQDLSSPDEVDLDWWVDSFKDASGHGAIEELVVSCALTDSTAGQVRILLDQWVRQGKVTLPE